MRIEVGRAKAWFAGRTRRERTLLTILAIVAAGVGLWSAYRVALAVREAAQDRYVRAAELSALAGSLADAGPASGAPVEDRVRASAEAAGLTVARHKTEAGVFTVYLEAVEAPRAFCWLATLEGEGLRPAALTVLREDDGTVQVEAGFRIAR